MNKSTFQKIIALSGIALFLVPSVLVFATTNTEQQVLTPDEDFPNIHRIFIYTKETLGNIISADTYHMKLKEQKEYYFWTSINIEAGSFQLSVTGPGGSHIEAKVWGTSDPKDARKMSFVFTPTSTGNYTIMVSTLIATDGGTYQLYVNRSGFAGFWWMIGLGLLAVIVLLGFPIMILRARKKKKKRKRKR